MRLRFRRSLRIAPGLRLNLAKRGVSLSAGRRGLTYNLNRDGGRTTFGAPGTGLAFSTKRKRIGATHASAGSAIAGLLLILALAYALGWL